TGHRVRWVRLLHRRSLRQLQTHSLEERSMVIRIDDRRLKEPGGLHAVFAETLGLSSDVGKNLDALVDVLTHLDHPQTTLARVKVPPGEIVVIMIEQRDAKDRKVTSVLRSLLDVIA